VIRRKRRKESTGGEVAPTGYDGAVPHTDYADGAGDVLTLRWALPARSRLLYARMRAAAPGDEMSGRAAEFLFRRLAVRWEIGGIAVRGRTALIERYREATESQREFVCAALAEHAAEHFPELELP
jgi:hypothetical protein